MAEDSSPRYELDDEFDVPPLEDFSELIGQVNKLETDDSHQSLAIESTSSTPKDERVKKLPSSSKDQKSAAPRVSNFGGFKKGFLNNTKAIKGKPALSSRPTTKTDDIPVIKPKNPMERKNKMEIPEVQEAMKSNIPSLENKEWITDDLLKKIEANPSLAKLLMDPKFTAALSQVQEDPVKAMAMISSNPEMQKALQEFSGILGEHFTLLGHSEQISTAPRNIGLTEHRTPTQQGPVSLTPSPEDEAKMQELLSDPEVMKALQDHHIQKLLTLMKTNPDAAQLEVKNATADTRAKIQKLVEVGLLGFT